MNEEQLGFDPTIMTAGSKRFIQIERNGQQERLIIDELVKRSPSIVGRATTCWKAHREGDDLWTPLVIKDSWQYPERPQEGEMIREATEKGVVNAARYYYHETVSVGNQDDDVESNVRKGLDIYVKEIKRCYLQDLAFRGPSYLHSEDIMCRFHGLTICTNAVCSCELSSFAVMRNEVFSSTSTFLQR